MPEILRAPEGLALTGKDESVFAEWKPVLGAAGYKLFFYNAVEPDKCIKSRYAQESKKTVLGFKNGTEYLVSVCAFVYDEGREVLGEMSRQRSVTPFCPNLKAPAVVCLKTGESAALRCEYNGANPHVTFRVNNPAVARVNASGVVTAVGKGVTHVKITADDGKFVYSKIAVERSLSFGRNKAVLMLAGDMMCAVNHQKAAKKFSYDFHYSFSAIKPVLDTADFKIGVLETSCYDESPFESERLRLEGGSPNCNSPSTFISAIADAGFDGLVTANNHNCDTGKAGLEATVSEIKRVGMKNIGTLGDNPVVVDVRGFKIGIVACCMVSNGLENEILEDGAGVVNIIGKYDKDYFVELINTAYAMGAEYIIAYQHWGGMNTLQVRRIQTEAAKFMAQAGAHLIVGSHPHVVQRFSYIGTSDGRVVPCAYSLGNFLTSMNEMKENRDGALLRVELTREAGKVKARYSYVPCYSEIREYGAVTTPVYPPRSEETRESFARTKENIGARINQFPFRPKVLLSGSELLCKIFDAGKELRVDKTAVYCSQLSLGSAKSADFDCGEDKKLALEIKKNIAEQAKEIAPDYIAVDFYTAGTVSIHRLGAADEEASYYTNINRFRKSQFFTDRKRELVRVRPPFGESIWKPLVRNYAQRLLEIIPHDRIILFRCSITASRFKKTELRTVDPNERTARFIRAMEDYFISVCNPAVVDLSGKYFSAADGEADFEPEYYHNAYKAALEIISGKGASCISVPDEDIWFERVLKYYDNMTARAYQGRLLDLDNAADKIIAQTSKDFAAQNKSRLLKLRRAGKSDISAVKDFFANDPGAAELVRAAEIIDIVGKGNLDKPYDFYEPAFSGHFNIVKSMIRRLSSQIGASVNENNAELAFLLRGKPQLRLYLSELEDNTVDIWGSCVSREALNKCKRAQIGKYVFKQSPILIYEPPVEVEFPEGAEAFCNSKWRRKMMLDAFTRKGFDAVEESRGQWILVDFYDLICKMAEYRGQLFEIDDFVLRTDFYKSIKSECKECYLFEKRDMKYCFEMISRFAGEISDIYGDNIILIKTEPKKRYITLDYRLEKLPDEGMYDIKRKFISLCEERFASVTGCYVIDISKHFYSSDKFPLGGAHIVHYEEEFYNAAGEYISRILSGDENRIYSTVDDKYILLRDLKLERD